MQTQIAKVIRKNQQETAMLVDKITAERERQGLYPIFSGSEEHRYMWSAMYRCINYDIINGSETQHDTPSHPNNQ